LTAATGLAWSFSSLAVIRLLFGAGESGCFPGLARVFRTWLPASERGRAEGIKAASARVGAALTPPLIALLYTAFSWRQIFILFGAIGIVWGVLFHRWYRDDPSVHPDVSEDERRLLSAGDGSDPTHGRETPWAAILRSRSVWALGVQWFCHYYGFYFYITWLPIYLLQARGLSLGRGALGASLPLLAAALGSYSGGAALNWAIKRTGSVSKTRKLFGYVAYAGAAVLLLAFTSIADPVWALAALSCSSFLAELSGPISWTSAMDIGGENVGTVSGFMNMLGHFGGAIAPAVTGFLLTSSGNAWNLAFYCSAAIYALGALCWIFIEPAPVARR
jgi:MFS family permease